MGGVVVLLLFAAKLSVWAVPEEEEVEQEEGRVGRWSCILICARVYVCVCVVCVLRESVLRVVW